MAEFDFPKPKQALKGAALKTPDDYKTIALAYAEEAKTKFLLHVASLKIAEERGWQNLQQFEALQLFLADKPNVAAVTIDTLSPAQLLVLLRMTNTHLYEKITSLELAEGLIAEQIVSELKK